MLEKKLNGSIVKGTVVSDAMDKTIVVKVKRKVKHPLYGKVIIKSNKFHAHVPENLSCKVGDVVAIQECPPVSKKKHWMLLEIIESDLDSN